MVVRAYILATVSLGGEYEVLEYVMRNLATAPGVKVEADVVYGAFDLVIVVEVQDLSCLDDVVTRIRKHPKVVKTLTLISSRAR